MVNSLQSVVMLLTDSVAIAGASVVAVAGVLAGLLMLGYAARKRTPSPPPVLPTTIYSSLTFTIPYQYMYIENTNKSFWQIKVLMFTFVA
jgi:hypothetical protein